jgi:hypothetical protein
MTTLKNKDRYFKLADAANYTFGSSGPGHDPYRHQTEQLRFKVISDVQVVAAYQAISVFPVTKDLTEASAQAVPAAMDMVEKGLVRFEKDYKEKTGETVKFSVDESTIEHSVELTSCNPYSKLRRGFVRVTVIIDVKGKEPVNESKKLTSSSLQKMVKEAVRKTIKELHDDFDAVESELASFNVGTEVMPASEFMRATIGRGYVYQVVGLTSRGKPAVLVFWPSDETFGLWPIDDLVLTGVEKPNYSFPNLHSI